MKILCCIPARYHSSRLNGKPLLKINGISIIEHTYKQACKMNVDEIIILTDDDRILKEVTSFGGKCVIIDEECLNGTERICRYLDKIDHSNYDLIFNIQGDEPFIDHEVCNNLIDEHRMITNKDVVCSTLSYKTYDYDEIMNFSRGKLVADNHNNIMYCSRNIIPISKTGNPCGHHDYNIHVGIFLFNKDYLLEHYMTENTPLQMVEDIEWLKILEQGYKIHVVFGNKMERGIDTPDDYEYLCNKYNI